MSLTACYYLRGIFTDKYGVVRFQTRLGGNFSDSRASGISTLDVEMKELRTTDYPGVIGNLTAGKTIIATGLLKSQSVEKCVIKRQGLKTMIYC